MDEQRNPRWSDELLQLCTPDQFAVNIYLHEFSELGTGLERAGFSLEERREIINRLAPKLRLVAQRAAKMAANQLKGTLKYLSDERTVDEWLQMLDDDLTDTLNYVDLLKDKLGEGDAEQANEFRMLREEFG